MKWVAYQNALEGSVVDLRNEDLDAKARRNESSEHGNSTQCERYHQKLALEPLRSREDVDLLSGKIISNNLLMPEVPLPDLNLGHTTHAPPNAQIRLLMLPPFRKDGAPNGIYNRIDGRKVAQEHPRRKPKSRRKDQKLEITLSEGKVESDLLAEAVADIVQVLCL